MTVFQELTAEVLLSLLREASQKNELSREKLEDILALSKETCLEISKNIDFIRTSYHELSMNNISELVQTLSLLDFALNENQERLIEQCLVKLRCSIQLNVDQST